VVAPLGSVTLIANVLFAPLLLGEKINRLGKIGWTFFNRNSFASEISSVCIIIIGSIISVWFASHDDKYYQLDEFFGLYLKPAFLIFALVIIVTIVVMAFALRYYNRLRLEALSSKANINQTLSLLEEGFVPPHCMIYCSISTDHGHIDTDNSSQQSQAMQLYQDLAIKMHRFLYPALSGIIGAQNVLFAKYPFWNAFSRKQIIDRWFVRCTAELLYGTVASGKMLFTHAPIYFVVLCLLTTIFFQIKYLNDGLRLFEASYVVPVFQTFWCIGSVASGLIFFVSKNTLLFVFVKHSLGGIRKYETWANDDVFPWNHSNCEWTFITVEKRCEHAGPSWPDYSEEDA
jgi:hypothetical protein